MSRAKTVHSKYQKTITTDEVFYQGDWGDFVNHFPAGFADVLRQRAGMLPGTAPDLLYRLRRIYIAYRPDKAQDVWLRPAKMKQKLEQLQRRLPSLPDWLIPPLNVHGKLVDFEAITWLRRAHDNLGGRAPVILMPGVPGPHPFDLLLEEGRDRYEIEPVVRRAIELLQVQAKGQGRQPNRNEWGFFIELCNLFYELTGEKPKAVRGMKYSSTAEAQPHLVKGRVIDFIEEIYRYYQLSYTRNGLAQKLVKSYAIDTQITKYGVLPAWI